MNLATVPDQSSCSESDSDTSPIIQKRHERRKINKANKRKSGMYRSCLEPKNKENSGGRKFYTKYLVRDKVKNKKHFPYFDIFVTFASKTVCIKNVNYKLSCKCYTGFRKGEECQIYSNGTVIIAVGAKDHFDIIKGPKVRCKKHKQEIRTFHYTKKSHKLYLGQGDEVVWSDGSQNYEWYTLIPFKEHQTYSNAHNKFKSKYNVDSVVFTVMLLLLLLLSSSLFVNIC